MGSKNRVSIKRLYLLICLTLYWLYPRNVKNLSTKKEQQSHMMISVDTFRLSSKVQCFQVTESKAVQQR